MTTSYSLGRWTSMQHVNGAADGELPGLLRGTLKSRFIKAATIEGRLPLGEVTDEQIDCHIEVARGGAAMTTVDYCGHLTRRARTATVALDSRNAAALRRLTDAVHAHDTLVCAPIGHAGLVANTRSNRTPTLAPSTRFSAPAMALVRGATAGRLDEVVGDFSARRNESAVRRLGWRGPARGARN